MIRCLLGLLWCQVLAASAAEYTVIVSKSTMQDAAWSKVVDALVVKHQGEVMTFGDSPQELKKALGGAAMPRWICWVACPQELGALAVSQMHHLARGLDGDPNPKVYLAIGNCLMGNIPASDDCMALAWIGSAGVRQMIGYTVPTWFGYGGWGVLDYFIEQPGRFTLQESWMANQHALVWKLGLLKSGLPKENPKPGSSSGNGEAAGLLHDRDVTVFYGDPKWEARMAPGPLRWKESLVENPPGDFTWTITPQAGKETFAPVDTNGSQRGGRLLVLLLPRRFASIEMLEGEAWKPVTGDDFILLPNPGTETAPPEKIVIRFRGK